MNPMATNEMRDRFLEAAAGVVRYWLAEARAPTALEKMNGVVFSLLVMLDGENAAVPGCQLIPFADCGDGWQALDIAGNLHEHWHRFQPKESS